MEVACLARAINGGIKINKWAQSTLPGLYAAGEVAGTPLGADRLEGNMIHICQVFGRRAGYYTNEDVHSRTIEAIPQETIDRAIEKD